MNDLYLIPEPGVTVRDPKTGKALPAEGGWKPRISYWLRRKRDGDVTEGTPPKATSATKADTSSKSTASKGDKA